jgi:transducin (beta)-like 1
VCGFFGPLTHLRPAIDEDDFENVRKRQMEDDQHHNQNGPTGKRPRLSNGYENGCDSTPKSPMEMDVDEEQNGDGNAYPSPEQVPSPAVVTSGPERGTQIEKVAELGSETTFLDLSDDSSAKNTVLLQCDFSPQDPTILAVAGTDALARMWTLSRNITAPDLNSNEMETDQPNSPQRPPYLSLLDEGAPSTTNVTSLAWASDGRLIAVASEPIDDNAAKIDIWTLEGTSISSFSGLEASVISLQWNPSNTLLLVLSPISLTGGILITVWLPTIQESRQYALSGLNATEQNLESVWTSNEEFVLCGGDILQAFHCSEGAISPLRKYETREGHALSKVAFDPHSQLLATASDTGMIDVGSPDQLFFFFVAI